MEDTNVREDGRLMAVSDLHTGMAENRRILETITPGSPKDWLIVAGDVAERVADIEQALGLLVDRFATVIWVPGNHELWTHPSDSVQLRGEERYRFLINMCRRLGVFTPEDPYPVWDGAGGPARIAPLFLLYDYSFLPSGASSKAEALEHAYASGLVFADEYLLHSVPYPSREAWCVSRVDLTERRLAACSDSEIPLVLVNHFPLLREPTEVLRHPHLALWCGSVRTADWHRRFNVVYVVYGHLHIPRLTIHDDVPFQEVSIGYPREWRRHGHPHGLLRPIFPIRSAR